MRYATFFVGILAGILELAGAIMGLGIAAVGFAFGGGGPISASVGVGITMVLAIATLFGAVLVMFVRDARPLAMLILGASIGAATAGGPFAVPGAICGLVAATLAYRLDRSAAMV